MNVASKKNENNANLGGPTMSEEVEMNEHMKAMWAGQSNVLVAVRVRPLMKHDVVKRSCVRALDSKVIVILDPASGDKQDILRANRSREKQYAFDYVFEAGSSQEAVYANTTKFLIHGVLDGYNATVFAYGQTGSGKTYTMIGGETERESGIMVRVMNDLFAASTRAAKQLSISFKVTVSFLEVYNENIRDLLSDVEEYLDLREDPIKGPVVASITEIEAVSSREIMDLLHQGNAKRSQAATAANEVSSRSHAVLQVVVEVRDRAPGTVANIKVGKLSLVDLAGSERAANTKNIGARLVEGANINRSLLALGNCINALGEKGNKGNFVPYRDSKLTRLLKDSLGGNCRTVMIANISSAESSFEETLNTLKYANRAKNIKTNVQRNVLNVNYHISEYVELINNLRSEIQLLKNQISSGPAVHGHGPGSSSDHQRVLTAAAAANIGYLRDGIAAAAGGGGSTPGLPGPGTRGGGLGGGREGVLSPIHPPPQPSTPFQALRESLRSGATYTPGGGGGNNSSSTSGLALLSAGEGGLTMAYTANNNRELVNNMRQRIVDNFQEKMQLRRSLIELEDQNVQNSIEVSKRQLVIVQWSEKHAAPFLRGGGGGAGGGEGGGGSIGGLTKANFAAYVLSHGAADITEAWQETEQLRKAIIKNNGMKKNIAKRLRHNEKEAEKFRDELGKNVTGEDRRELMALQYQVGRLELENMELEQHRIVHESILKGKDLVIQKLKLQLAVRDRLVHRQQAVLKEHGLDHLVGYEQVAIIEESLLMGGTRGGGSAGSPQGQPRHSSHGLGHGLSRNNSSGQLLLTMSSSGLGGGGGGMTALSSPSLTNKQAQIHPELPPSAATAMAARKHQAAAAKAVSEDEEGEEEEDNEYAQDGYEDADDEDADIEGDDDDDDDGQHKKKQLQNKKQQKKQQPLIKKKLRKVGSGQGARHHRRNSKGSLGGANSSSHDEEEDEGHKPLGGGKEGAAAVPKLRFQPPGGVAGGEAAGARASYTGRGGETILTSRDRDLLEQGDWSEIQSELSDHSFSLGGGNHHSSSHPPSHQAANNKQGNQQAANKQPQPLVAANNNSRRQPQQQQPVVVAPNLVVSNNNNSNISRITKQPAQQSLEIITSGPLIANSSSSSNTNGYNNNGGNRQAGGGGNNKIAGITPTAAASSAAAMVANSNGGVGSSAAVVTGPRGGRLYRAAVNDTSAEEAAPSMVQQIAAGAGAGGNNSKQSRYGHCINKQGSSHHHQPTAASLAAGAGHHSNNNNSDFEYSDGDDSLLGNNYPLYQHPTRQQAPAAAVNSNNSNGSNGVQAKYRHYNSPRAAREPSFKGNNSISSDKLDAAPGSIVIPPIAIAEAASAAGNAPGMLSGRAAAAAGKEITPRSTRLSEGRAALLAANSNGNGNKLGPLAAILPANNNSSSNGSMQQLKREESDNSMGGMLGSLASIGAGQVQQQSSLGSFQEHNDGISSRGYAGGGGGAGGAVGNNGNRRYRAGAGNVAGVGAGSSNNSKSSLGNIPALHPISSNMAAAAIPDVLEDTADALFTNDGNNNNPSADLGLDLMIKSKPLGNKQGGGAGGGGKLRLNNVNAAAAANPSATGGSSGVNSSRLPPPSEAEAAAMGGDGLNIQGNGLAGDNSSNGGGGAMHAANRPANRFRVNGRPKVISNSNLNNRQQQATALAAAANNDSSSNGNIIAGDEATNNEDASFGGGLRMKSLPILSGKPIIAAGGGGPQQMQQPNSARLNLNLHQMNSNSQLDTHHPQQQAN